MSYRFSNNGEKSNTQLVYEEIVNRHKLGILPVEFTSKNFVEYLGISINKISSSFRYLEGKGVLEIKKQGLNSLFFYSFVEEKDLVFHSKPIFSNRNIIKGVHRPRRKFETEDQKSKQSIKTLLNEIFDIICEIEKLLDQ